MSRTKTLLRSLLAIGAAGAIAAFGTFSAFSSTTSNPDNQIKAGTVTLGDNDVERPLYDIDLAKPGTEAERCIKVSYTGSLEADVKLYLAGDPGALGQYVDLTVTPGSQADAVFPACTNFVADTAATKFTGTLKQFADAHTGWADGQSATPNGAATWTAGRERVYRVHVKVRDDNAARGLSTGKHAFTWEARNR
jgi:predicted ribosomally synthesized peptide with SipW-like signal peptide